MTDKNLVSELLSTVDRYRCVHRKLHEVNRLSMSDMLVFGAVLRAEKENLPPPKMSEIARHADVTTAAISQIAAQLEQKELVERYSMSGDRRTVYVRITDKGREFYEAEVRHSQEMMQKAIEQMGEERAAQYLALSREFQQIVREL